MNPLLDRKLIATWLALLGLTALSCWLNSDVQTPESNAWRLAGSLILATAFFKVRLIFLYFMELRTAPVALRAVFEVWVLAACATLLSLYWLQP